MTARKERCRICGGDEKLKPIYSFGQQPVAGYLDERLAEAKAAPRFENAIGICSRCCLVQQMNDDAQTTLVERVYGTYQATYSMSRKVSSYLDTFLADALRIAGAKPGDAVIEIGSNDGSLLQLVADRGYSAFGFDPSASQADSGSVRVVRDFFTEESGKTFADANGPARLVLSRHTLEHAFDPLDFFRGVSKVLGADGCAVIEVPYVVHQIMNNQFQSFTFQHVSFFSIQSMMNIAEQVGLTVEDVRFVEMDAGSMIAVLRPRAGSSRKNQAIEALTSMERTMRYGTPEPYVDYFRNFEADRARIHDVLGGLNRSGAVVIGYGAGSKGQALVNMLELGREHLVAVIDDTPGTSGKFIPGPGLEVVARDQMDKATCVFITAPTHAKEIAARRQHGGPMYLATTPKFSCL